MSDLCIPAIWCVHDDHWYMRASLASFAATGPQTVFVSRVAWNGTVGNWQKSAQIAEEAGAEVVLGDWDSESEHRAFALQTMRERGHRNVLIPDSDEVADPTLLGTLMRIAAADIADIVRVRMDTYWKSPRYVIRPREEIAPVLLINTEVVHHSFIREYEGGRLIVLMPEHGVLHHLSYAGPDERIARKLETWSHRDEVIEGWYSRVWKGWDADPTLRDIHPTRPTWYGSAERIETPECLSEVPDHAPIHEDPTTLARWPKVSVVIPLYGGEEDIRLCLESLSKCQDLMYECIVVDDVSPDEAAMRANEFEFATVISNETNSGFAATCNHGYRQSTGDVVLFLNSDTVVPRAGLIRLIESLMTSGTIAAAGPFTNNASYHQPITPTYTDLKNLDLFARDFAHRQVPDSDVEMLVGFCLAVRRSALEELDEPPFDERFGRGFFEDNDLCYRLQRAGYRLRLSGRAYVHHKGSQSVTRMDAPTQLLEQNQMVYVRKWQEDIESGFASHLAGQSAEPIVFREDRSPQRIRDEIARLSDQADISLCMIVKNEERVLGDCLESIKGVFKQVVIVDTGSTDRTVEIARASGAEVYSHPWEDSFAAARNHSLSYAKGRWVVWMDADDTLPKASAEAILRAAATAPPQITGFVIPVQFVEDGPGAGTRVDHVKLFRNVPGLEFEGRIHEQVLPSLRAHGGEIARLDAVVLHSGYDTSEEGQVRKRERDWKLLNLELEERPNHPFVLFNCGMTAHYTNRHEEAVEWLRQSIANAQPAESHLRKAFSLMGVSLREMERLEEAVAAFQEGLDLVGEDPELHFQKALTLSALDRMEEARNEYLAMPLDVDGHFSSVDLGILTFKRDHNLAQVCYALCRYTEAKEHWKKAIQSNPRFAASAFALFEAAEAVGDVLAMREACDAIRVSVGPGEEWAVKELKLGQMYGLDPTQALLRLVREHPGAVGPETLLVRRMLEEGNEEAAQPLLLRLAGAGSSEAAFFLGVSAIRRGDLPKALEHMREAHRLNPSHERTTEQIAALERALAGV